MRKTNIQNLDPQFINRWSPRAFKADPIPADHIQTMFEAARWAPSCFNEQPWLFTYATSDQDRQHYLSAMVDFNQSWAKAAPLLVMGFTNTVFEKNDKPNGWAEFDAGAAWMSLCLQAEKLGYRCHAMAGFDADKALEVAGLKDTTYKAVVMVAIGKEGEKSTLPAELQEKEGLSDRKPLNQMIYEGKAR